MVYNQPLKTDRQNGLREVQFLSFRFSFGILFSVIYVCKLGRCQCAEIYWRLQIINIRCWLSIAVLGGGLAATPLYFF
jgi:hypothetical protein